MNFRVIFFHNGKNKSKKIHAKIHPAHSLAFQTHLTQKQASALESTGKGESMEGRGQGGGGAGREGQHGAPNQGEGLELVAKRGTKSRPHYITTEVLGPSM